MPEDTQGPSAAGPPHAEHRPKGMLGRLKDVLNYQFHPKDRRGLDHRLGQRLIEMDAITEEQYREAVRAQKHNGKLLSELLLEWGYVNREEVARAQSQELEIEYAPLDSRASTREALEAMPESMAVKYRMVPVALDGDRLTVLIDTPDTCNSLRDVSILLGLRLHPVLTACEDIRAEIKARYHTSKVKKTRPQSLIMTPEDRARLAQEVEAPKEEAVETPPAPKPAESAPRLERKLTDSGITEARFRQIAQQASGVPAMKMVSTIVEEAIKSGATDIHLDPQDPEMRVRYRIDGVLHDVMSIPQSIEGAVVSRIKILADIDITETRHPQDGHISLEIGRRECDVRVATMPTFLGERVVMRLLDQSAVLAGVGDLGLEQDDEVRLRKLIAEPYGMILVTGPTGSGKTTTLYAALHERDAKRDSIVTLEDPVEYQIPGINQVQVDPEIGLTFASTLRAALRQDIDVLLVGEIRDAETAHIAVRAAMTGHLVFSTLHTNDAAEAIATLLNMGVPPYLIASALTGVVGQRLARTICKGCRTEYEPPKPLLESLGLPEDTAALYKGAGCETCYHTGVRGRTGVFEILGITPAIRRMITEGERLEAIVRESGMPTLAQRAREKVRQGILPAEEYMRVARE